MNGNSPTPAYNLRDLTRREWEQAARTLGKITLDAPYISGPLGVGPVDSEVIPPANFCVNSGHLQAIPPGFDFEIISPADTEPKYEPIDARPAKQRRANKRLYSKARAYYGKTYIVTRAQMLLGLVVTAGLILTLSASGALVMLYALGLGRYL